MVHVRTLDSDIINAAATDFPALIIPSGGVPIGNLVVAHVVCTGTGGTTPTVTVTDPRSNTWVSISAAITGITVSSQLFVTRVTTALVGGDSLTFHLSVSRTRAAITLDEFDNVIAGVNEATTATSGSAASLSLGPTGAVSHADELVLACAASTSGKTYSAAMFALASTNQSTSGTTDRGGALFWKVIRTAGLSPQSATIALSPSAVVCGALATFPATETFGPFGPATYVWENDELVPVTVLGVWNGSTAEPATLSISV